MVWWVWSLVNAAGVVAGSCGRDECLGVVEVDAVGW